MKNFIANWRRDAGRKKRGGDVDVVSLDMNDAEQILAGEITSSEGPDSLFNRTWANQLLNLARERVRGAWVKAGHTDRFEALRGCLDDPGETPDYPGLSERLRLSESGVRTAVARLREQFRKFYREEVARVVAGPEEVDDEIPALIGSF